MPAAQRVCWGQNIKPKDQVSRRTVSRISVINKKKQCQGRVVLLIASSRDPVSGALTYFRADLPAPTPPPTVYLPEQESKSPHQNLLLSTSTTSRPVPVSSRARRQLHPQNRLKQRILLETGEWLRERDLSPLSRQGVCLENYKA